MPSRAIFAFAMLIKPYPVGGDKKSITDAAYRNKSLGNSHANGPRPSPTTSFDPTRRPRGSTIIEAAATDRWLKWSPALETGAEEINIPRGDHRFKSYLDRHGLIRSRI